MLDKIEKILDKEAGSLKSIFDLTVFNFMIVELDKECLNWILREICQNYFKNGKLDSQAVSLLNYSFQLRDNAISYYNILEQIGDRHFTIAILNLKSDTTVNHKLGRLLFDNYRIDMAQYNSYVTWVFNNNSIAANEIMNYIDYIKYHYPNNVNGLYSLLVHPGLNSDQLDQVTFFLTKGSTIIPSYGLLLLYHANINFKIIKNHLDNENCKKLLLMNVKICADFAKASLSKSNLDRSLILSVFPFLADYGLKADPLGSTIEVLGESND